MPWKAFFIAAAIVLPTLVCSEADALVIDRGTIRSREHLPESIQVSVKGVGDELEFEVRVDARELHGSKSFSGDIVANAYLPATDPESSKTKRVKGKLEMNETVFIFRLPRDQVKETNLSVQLHLVGTDGIGILGGGVHMGLALGAFLPPPLTENQREE